MPLPSISPFQYRHHESLSPRFQKWEVRSKRIPLPERKMTVCVAAICELNRIVLVSDKKLTMVGDWSYEPSTSKVFQLGSTEVQDGHQRVIDRLAVMYAGDSGIATEVVRELHRMVQPGSPTRPDPFHVEDVANLYPIAYGQVRDRHAYGEILAPDRVTPEALRAGKHKLAPEYARDCLRRLKKFRLPSVSLIIAGIDPDGSAHLWQTDGAKKFCTDTQGFSVIGSGWAHALSRMMIAKWSPRMSRAEALLHTYEAKKEADEIVGTVGPETDISMLGADTAAHGSPLIPQFVQMIDSVRKTWIEADAEQFAAALEVISPHVTETPPVLHGDGVTDDTASIQWYIDHMMPLPITPRGYAFRAEALRLPDGAFLVGGKG